MHTQTQKIIIERRNECLFFRCTYVFTSPRSGCFRC